jgi:hypothetical protein
LWVLAGAFAARAWLQISPRAHCVIVRTLDDHLAGNRRAPRTPKPLAVQFGQLVAWAAVATGQSLHFVGG